MSTLTGYMIAFASIRGQDFTVSHSTNRGLMILLMILVAYICLLIFFTFINFVFAGKGRFQGQGNIRVFV